MHETFNFPINCHSPQIPLKNPQLVRTELGTYITGDMDMERSYDAFDNVELIPSFLEVIEKIQKIYSYHEDKRNIDLIVKWVEKWGFLKAESFDIAGLNGYGQSIGDFIDEGFKFRDLWSLYTIIANRDLEKLKEISKVYVLDTDEVTAATHTFWFFEDKHYSDFIDGIFDEENPLISYQQEAMAFIGDNIESYINDNKLFWQKLSCESSSDKDYYKFTPGFGFMKLINTIYMQFFILLTENTKKICPVCNKPFFPERKDRLYCSDTCRHTAKSRRHRARKLDMFK